MPDHLKALALEFATDEAHTRCTGVRFRDPGARRAIGERGEEQVCRHLERGGYRILERNARVGRAEIDIIATRGRVLAFCEVRSRRGGKIDPLETIDRRKRERIRAAGMRWIDERGLPVSGKTLRFDAAAVTFEGDEAQIVYVENAF